MRLGYIYLGKLRQNGQMIHERIRNFICKSIKILNININKIFNGKINYRSQNFVEFIIDIISKSVTVPTLFLLAFIFLSYSSQPNIKLSDEVIGIIFSTIIIIINILVLFFVYVYSFKKLYINQNTLEKVYCIEKKYMQKLFLLVSLILYSSSLLTSFLVMHIILGVYIRSLLEVIYNSGFISLDVILESSQVILASFLAPISGLIVAAIFRYIIEFI